MIIKILSDDKMREITIVKGASHSRLSQTEESLQSVTLEMAPDPAVVTALEDFAKDLRLAGDPMF